VPPPKLQKQSTIQKAMAVMEAQVKADQKSKKNVKKVYKLDTGWKTGGQVSGNTLLKYLVLLIELCGNIQVLKSTHFSSSNSIINAFPSG
jgi:hypothetical protein